MGRKRKFFERCRLPVRVASSAGMATAARYAAATTATRRTGRTVTAATSTGGPGRAPTTASAGRSILWSALPARRAVAAAGVAAILRRGLPGCTRSSKPVPASAILRGGSWRCTLRRARRILAASRIAESLPSAAGSGSRCGARSTTRSRTGTAARLQRGRARRGALGSRGPPELPRSGLPLAGCRPCASASHGIAGFGRTASSLLKPALLLGKRNPRRGGRLLVREKPGVRARARTRRRAHLPVGEPQIRAGRRHGHLATNETRRAHLFSRNPPDVVEPAAPEIGGIDP